YLHRAADPLGRAAWTNALMAGLGETDLARSFLTSAEYAATHESAASFVVGLYEDVLGRTADAAGAVVWARACQALGREAVVGAFLSAPEAMGRLLDADYRDYLGRAADVSGRASWEGVLLRRQLSPELVAMMFLASDEFLARA